MKNNYILREDDNQWQKLVEQLPVMIFESSVDNNILYVSENVFDTLGYTPKELIGKKAIEQFHPADRERLLENIRKKIESGGNIDTRYHIRKKNGDYIAAIFRSVPVKKGQETIGLLGAAIDISATEKLESELADSEARYRSLFTNAPLGIYRSTPDGRIIVVNPALVKMMGYGSPEELQKINLEEKNQQSDFGRALFKKKLEAEGEIIAREALWTKKDGTYIWVRENATLIKDVQGKPLYYDGVVEDITFRKNAESLLRRQRDLLNMSQEMAHMGSWEEDLLSGTVLWSREEYRIFELPERTPASEKLFFGFVHPEDRHLLRKRMVMLSCEAGEMEAEYRIRVNGKEKWIRSIMTSHCDNNGKAIRLYGMDMDITKEKNQQLQLEKESAMLKKTQKLGRIGSWELNIKTKEVKASEVLTDLYDLPKKERFTLSDFTRRIHPDDLEARGMAKGDWSVLKEGKFDSTYRLLVNGKTSWVKAVGEVLYNEEKEPVSVVAAVQDITSRKNNEIELKQLEQEKEAIIQGIPDMIFIVDREGVYRDFIPGIDNQPMISPKEFLGKKITDIFSREIAQKHFSLLQKAFKTGQVQTSEYSLKHTNGELNYYEARFSKMNNNRVVVVVRDVTQRKKYLMSVQEMAAIVDSSDAIIIGKTLNGVISSWNRGAERVYGYKAEEVIGLPINVIVPPDLKKELKRFTSSIRAGDRVENFETRRVCKNSKEVEVSLSISGIKDEEGILTGISVVGQDITRQKQLERELIKEKEVAENATRTKSLFLANMSHEIRTPLNAILGFSHILSKKLKDPVQKEYLESMQSSGESLLNLVNDLLDLSKAEAGKMEFHRQSTDVRFLVHDIESIFRLKAMQKQLDFKVTVAKNVPRDLFVDELKIRQILLNLTSNAIKFTEKGFVKIHVRAENIKKDKASLVLEVQDTGKGIPAQYHEKIFKLFEQQNPAISKQYGGTGLGLTIIQQIVSKMNGHIELDSEEGKGSLFRVILPDISQTGEKGQRKKQEEQILQPVLFEPATVLIVDDTENNRHVLKGFLEDFPFTVLEAENGRQALQRLSENKADLVFMDIRMPVMDGLEAVKKIRAREEWSHIPIVALTASSSEFEGKKLEVKGFNTYLRKPASMQQIEKTLRDFLPFGPVAGKENIPAALSEGVLKNFHALMKELEEKVMPLQRELLGIRPRQKVRTMAQLLLDIGKNRDAAEVIRYGKRLMTANMNFQLEKEKDLIDNFTLWMEQLKERYNK